MNNMSYKYDGTPYKTLQEALKLAKQAVQGEREDELFYTYLISEAPTKEEKDIIADIREDERKHNKMFREIYAYFTNEELPKAGNTEFKEPISYIAGIKKAFFGELAAMERYRIIRAGIPIRYYRDMVFEILTDEMKHADKYNYILNLNLEDSSSLGATQKNGGYPQDNDMSYSEGNDMLNQMVDYIYPLVYQAMKEAEAGADPEQLFTKYILAGVLIGSGYTVDQVMAQVENWGNTY